MGMSLLSILTFPVILWRVAIMADDRWRMADGGWRVAGSGFDRGEGALRQ